MKASQQEKRIRTDIQRFRLSPEPRSLLNHADLILNRARGQVHKIGLRHSCRSSCNLQHDNPRLLTYRPQTPPRSGRRGSGKCRWNIGLCHRMVCSGGSARTSRLDTIPMPFAEVKPSGSSFCRDIMHASARRTLLPDNPNWLVLWSSAGKFLH